MANKISMMGITPSAFRTCPTAIYTAVKHLSSNCTINHDNTSCWRRNRAA